MSDTELPAEVPARLRSMLIDALVDTEQARHRLDAAMQAADALEQRIDGAAEAGLIKQDDPLFEYTRALASAAHAAAAASLQVAERVARLR